MTNKDVHLSKSLAWILRHGATSEGLKVSPAGFIGVDDILQHRSFKNYTYEDIERVVVTNNKQRFKLRMNPSTDALEIRANQGHSIAEVSESAIGLIPILKPKYNSVVHGTYIKCWPQILAQGLSRMNRHHIHFAKGILGDPSVRSGVRADAQIYIHINLEKALRGGIKFYESENGVVLTPGNHDGYLPSRYFSKVVDVQTGRSWKY